MLPVLHVHYKAASSTAPTTCCLPRYICTIKWPVLRPQLSEATFVPVLHLHYQVACPEATAPRSCFPHITFALQVATSEGHSCGTLLWCTPAGHSRGTLLYDTLEGHSCRTLLWDTLVYRTLLSDTGHSCRTLLWDTLVRLGLRWCQSRHHPCRSHTSSKSVTTAS